MDSIDDFESSNAREWEETIESKPLSHFHTRTQSLITDDGYKIDRHSQLNSICAPVKFTKGHASTEQLWNTQNKGNTESNPSVSIQQQRSRQSCNQESNASKLKRFPKTTAVPRTRKIDEMEKEAVKSAQETAYTKQPPHDELRATGYYLWPDRSSSPNDLLGEGLKLLDEVRKQYHVYVDFVECLGCIRIRADNDMNIQDGLDAVKSVVRQAKAAASGLRPLYIVEPPIMPFKFSPKFKSSKTVKQPVVEKILLEGYEPSKDECSKWEDQRNLILQSNEKLFKEHVEKTFAELGELTSCLRMRVHFGQMHLTMYRKNFDANYMFEDFSKMMKETRTKAHLEKGIGDASYAPKIMQSIKMAPSLFCPIALRNSGFSKVKPTHNLVIWARNSRQTQVRVEASIDMVDDGLSNLENTWQIGTTNFYEYGTGKTRLSIGVIDPESTLDWCLEVVTNDNLKKIPQEFYLLVVNSLVGKATDENSQLGWSYPSVILQVPPGITVDNTWIKSIMRYRIMDTSYILEASIYRRWEGSDTKREPSVLCGVSIYNKEWDVLMGPEESGIPDRNWTIGLNDLFPNGTGSRSGFSDFVSNIKIVQSFLESI